MAILPEISEAFCEPFADSSQIATLLAAGSARRHVSHMLTGDGGDELVAPEKPPGCIHCKA
ncbi:asparagine synthase-related protein [Xanthomonas cissicola]|uniref:asparagine synthase-related protein n=1 Tax=Xanthomonas cissicola TaxID=86186 RepID=UPI001F3E6567|nr:asparagine synthase-related protein [Xanthomonas cissicola]